MKIHCQSLGKPHIHCFMKLDLSFSSTANPLGSLIFIVLWSSTCEQEPHLNPLPIPWEASYSLFMKLDLWTRTTFHKSTANPLGSLIFIVLWSSTCEQEPHLNPSLGKPHIHCFMKLDLWTRTTFASTANPLGSLIFIVLWSSTCEQEPHLHPLPIPWEASYSLFYEARPVNKNHICIHCQSLGKPHIHCLWSSTCEQEPHLNPLPIPWEASYSLCYEARPVNKNHIWIDCQSLGKPHIHCLWSSTCEQEPHLHPLPIPWEPHIHCFMKLDLWTRTTFASTANPLGSLIFIVYEGRPVNKNHIWIHCQSLGKPHIHCFMKLDLWTRTTFASTANEYEAWEASYSLCYEARPVNKNHICIHCQSLGKPHIHCVMKLDLWTRTTFASTANPLGSLIFIVLWRSTCEQEPHLHPLPIPWEASYSLCYEARPVNKNHICIHCQSLGKPHILHRSKLHKNCVMKLDLWTRTTFASTANPLGSLIFIVLWRSTCEQEPHLHPLPIPWEASYSLFYEARPVNKNHICIHCQSLGKPHIHCFMKLDLWTRTTFESTANPLGSLIFIVLWSSTCEQEPHLHPLPIPWEASYSLFYEARPVNKNHICIHCQSLGKPHIHCVMKLDLWTRTTFASTANPLGSLIFIVLWSFDLWTRTTFESTANPLGSLIFIVLWRSTCEQEPHLNPLPIPWEASYSLFYEGRPVNKNHICIHCQSLGKPHIHCFMKLDLWTRTTFASTANPLGSLIFIVLWSSTCEQEPHLHPLPIPWEASYSLFYEARPVNKNHICIHCQSLGKPHIHCFMKLDLWTRTTFASTANPLGSLIFIVLWSSTCEQEPHLNPLPIPWEASYSLFYEARPVNKNHIWIHCQSLGKPHIHCVMKLDLWTRTTFASTANPLGSLIFIVLWSSTCEQEPHLHPLPIPWEASYSLCYEARPVNKNHICIHCQSLGKPHIHCFMKLDLWTRTTFESTANPLGSLIFIVLWSSTCEQEPHLHPLPIPWEASYSYCFMKLDLWTRTTFASTANPLGSLIFIVLWSSTCEQEPHLHPLPIPWEASYSLFYEARPVNKNHIWIHWANPLGSLIFIVLWSSTCEQEPHLHPLPIPWEASYSLFYEARPVNKNHIWIHCQSLGKPHIHCVMKLDLWTRTTFASTANPLGSLIFIVLWSSTCEQEPHLHPLPIPWEASYSLFYEARPVNKNHICIHCQSLGKPHIHCFMKLDLWTRTTFESTANPLGSLIFIVLWSSTCEQEPHLHPLPIPWEASYSLFYEARPVNKNHIWIHCQSLGKPHIHCFMKLDLWTRTTFESTANPLGSLIFIVLWRSTCEQEPHLNPLPIPWEASYSLCYEARPVCNCQSLGKPIFIDLWTTFASTANPLGSLIFIVLWSSTCEQEPHLNPLPIPWEASYSLFYEARPVNKNHICIHCQSLGKPHIHCFMKLDLWTRTTFESTANPLGSLIFIVLWSSTCEQEPHLNPLPIPWEASYSLFYEARPVNKNHIWIHCQSLGKPHIHCVMKLDLWTRTTFASTANPLGSLIFIVLCSQVDLWTRTTFASTANPLGSLIFIVLWSSTCEQEPHLHPLPIPWEASYSLFYEARPVNKNHICIHCQSLGKPHIHCFMKNSTCEQEPHLNPLPIPWEASYSLFYEARPVNKNHIWIHCQSLGKPHIHCFMKLDLWTRTTFASTANPLGSLIFIVLWSSTCEQEPHLHPLPIPWEASYSLFYEARPVNKNHICIHCQSLGKPHIHCFMKLDLWTRTTFASTANPLGSLIFIVLWSSPVNKVPWSIFIVLWSSTCEQEPHLHPLPIPWEASYSLFYGTCARTTFGSTQSLGKPHIHCFMKVDLWTRTTFESTANPLGSLIFIVLWSSTCEPHIHCQSLGKPHIHCFMNLTCEQEPMHPLANPLGSLIFIVLWSIFIVLWSSTCEQEPHLHPLPIPSIFIVLWRSTCEQEPHLETCEQEPHLNPLPIPWEASYSLFYEGRPVNKNHIWIHCQSLGKPHPIVLWSSTCEQEPHFNPLPIPWEASYSLCWAS